MTTKEDDKKGTAVAAAQSTGVAALPDYMQGAEDHAGLGNSRDAADNSMPFLSILQKGSPQVNKQDPAYIPKAEAGMLLNTATGQVWSGEDGVPVVPCGIQKAFVEWVPREKGGGYVATYPHDPGLPREMGAREDDRRRLVLENGNHLVETLYTLALLPDGSPVVVGATSTALKPMRDWMTTRNAQRLPGGRTAPAFAKTYRLKTLWQKNDSGDWYTWKVFIEDGWTSADIYPAALEFAKQIAEKGVTIGRPVDDRVEGGAAAPQHDHTVDDGVPM